MLYSCQNLAMGFSPVKNLLQTNPFHENASSCSLAEKKRHHLLGGLFVLLMFVYFFGLHNRQPVALSLRALRCWFLVLVACPSSYLIHAHILKSPYPSGQTLLTCSIALNCHHKEALPKELLGVLENTAHRKLYLDQKQTLHHGPGLKPSFQERIFQNTELT